MNEKQHYSANMKEDQDMVDIKQEDEGKKWKGDNVQTIHLKNSFIIFFIQ